MAGAALNAPVLFLGFFFLICGGRSCYTLGGGPVSMLHRYGIKKRAFLRSSPGVNSHYGETLIATIASNPVRLSRHDSQ
jgi:hypothetical protein